MPPKSHGMSKHPLYGKWQDMLQRCYNPSCQRYPYYGAAGVTVCDEWRSDPVAFITWSLANGWKPGMDLDKDIKTPGNKEYSPAHCTYVPHRENMLAVVSRASRRKTAKLKLFPEDVLAIGQRYGAGESSRQLAQEYGVALTTIQRACREYAGT